MNGQRVYFAYDEHGHGHYEDHIEILIDIAACTYAPEQHQSSITYKDEHTAKEREFLYIAFMYHHS